MRLITICRTCVAGAVVVGLAGCSAGAPDVDTRPSQPLPKYVVDGPGCAEARARARAEPPPVGIIPATPTQVSLVKRPDAVRTKSTVIVRVSVDSAGRPLENGITIEGTSDPSFERQLRRNAERATYRPAVLDGCGVAGVVTITFQFAGSSPE